MPEVNPILTRGDGQYSLIGMFDKFDKGMRDRYRVGTENLLNTTVTLRVNRLIDYSQSIDVKIVDLLNL